MPEKSPLRFVHTVLRLLFAFDWFPEPAGLDGRRRATRALRAFTELADKIAWGNAVLMALGWFVFAYWLSVVLGDPLADPLPIARKFLGLDDAPLEQIARLVFHYAQAQLSIQGLHLIHRRIAAVALNDGD